MRGLDPTLPTLPQLPSASRVRGAYLVLPPAPFRGRSPPASPTSTPVFDCVIYSQRDGTRSWQLQRKWIYFHGPATGQKAVVGVHAPTVNGRCLYPNFRATEDSVFRALLSRYRYAVPTVLHSEYYLVLLPKYSIGSINGICADRSISVKSIQVYYLNLKRQEN